MVESSAMALSKSATIWRMTFDVESRVTNSESVSACGVRISGTPP